MPIPVCTKAYLEAFKFYDKLSKESGKRTIKTVVFVGATDAIVSAIKQRLCSDLLKDLSMEEYNEDAIFVNEAIKVMGVRKNGDLLRSRDDQGKQFQSDHLMVAHSTPARQEQVVIRVSQRSALEQSPDLIVVVGELFQELHSGHSFDIRQIMIVNVAFPQIEHLFRVFGGEKTSPLIFELLIEDYKEENFNKAFEFLGEVTAGITSQMAHVKSVVFTSSALYSSKFGISI